MPHSGTPSLQDPPAEPMPLFDAWYARARACAEIKYAHAVCLSTIDPGGLPDARTVLLELHDTSGFVVFTDSGSIKAAQLARTPEAALTFYWGPLDRQVRVRGRVERASDAVADECWSHRPRGARITAWASRQSRELDTEGLAERVERVTASFAETEEIPRPAHWRAYQLLPRSVEFWRARSHRLHDRLEYRVSAHGGWTLRRLEP